MFDPVKLPKTSLKPQPEMDNYQQGNQALKCLLLGTGTSQGVPVVGCSCPVCSSTDPRDQRLRCSAIVEDGTTRILIDLGPDLRRQLLRAQIHDVDAVLMTHEHQDHTAGLDDLRPINFQQGHSIPIYGRPQVLDRLRQQYAYIFENSGYPGLPQIELRSLPEQPFDLGTLHVEPLPAFHGQLPVVGYRIGDLAYLTDVNFIPSATQERLQDLRHLILDALHRQPHHSHFHLEAAIEQAQKLNPTHTYFLHISHHMGLHEAVERELPPNIHLAYDGLRLAGHVPS